MQTLEPQQLTNTHGGTAARCVPVCHPAPLPPCHPPVCPPPPCVPTPCHPAPQQNQYRWGSWGWAQQAPRWRGWW